MTPDLLIVVDMQEGFHCPETENIVSKIKKIIQSFEGEVVFSCFRNPESSFFEDQLSWYDFQNKEDVELLEELKPFKENIIFHAGYTIFNQEMKELVQKEDIEKIYLTGVYTGVCITKAAMDIFDKGIEVSVISDACASPHGIESHKAALDTLKHVIGEENVVSMENIIEKN